MLSGRVLVVVICGRAERQVKAMELMKCFCAAGKSQAVAGQAGLSARCGSAPSSACSQDGGQTCPQVMGRNQAAARTVPGVLESGEASWPASPDPAQASAVQPCF